MVAIGHDFGPHCLLFPAYPRLLAACFSLPLPRSPAVQCPLLKVYNGQTRLNATSIDCRARTRRHRAGLCLTLSRWISMTHRSPVSSPASCPGIPLQDACSLGARDAPCACGSALPLTADSLFQLATGGRSHVDAVFHEPRCKFRWVLIRGRLLDVTAFHGGKGSLRQVAAIACTH